MTVQTHVVSSRTRRYLAPLLLSLAAAATVATPALADNGRDRGRPDHSWNDRGRGHDDRRDDRYDRRGDRRWDHGQRDRYSRDRDWQREQARRYEQQRRWERDRAYYNGRYAPPRVVVHSRPVVRYVGPPAWSRGRDYRSYGYSNVHYVPYDDYGRYDLYSPGYGQRWVRDDRGNFLLVAVATGIIASILTR